MSRLARALAVVALAGPALVGCSSGSASNFSVGAVVTFAAPTTTVAPDAGLEPAVRAWSAALVAGDVNGGYALLSARCRAKMTTTQFSALTDAVHGTYPNAKLLTYHEDVVFGLSAAVTYTYDQPLLNQSAQKWTKEAAGWRWDAC